MYSMHSIKETFIVLITHNFDKWLPEYFVTSRKPKRVNNYETVKQFKL